MYIETLQLLELFILFFFVSFNFGWSPLFGSLGFSFFLRAEDVIVVVVVVIDDDFDVCLF